MKRPKNEPPHFGYRQLRDTEPSGQVRIYHAAIDRGELPTDRMTIVSADGNELFRVDGVLDFDWTEKQLIAICRIYQQGHARGMKAGRRKLRRELRSLLGGVR